MAYIRRLSNWAIFGSAALLHAPHITPHTLLPHKSCEDRTSSSLKATVWQMQSVCRSVYVGWVGGRWGGVTIPLYQKLTQSTNTNEHLQIAFLPSPTRLCSFGEWDACLIDLCILGGWHSTWPTEDKDGYTNENLSPVGNKDIKTKPNKESCRSGAIQDTGMGTVAQIYLRIIWNRARRPHRSS